MSAPEVVVAAVGDIFLNRPSPESAFDEVAGILGGADVVFGNCEGPYSTEQSEPVDLRLAADPSAAKGLAAAGFSVMSLANNHIMDGGDHGLTLTMESLHAVGVATAGAGPTLALAHRPGLTVTPAGATVATLAYASFFHLDTDATHDRPGIAVVRASTEPVSPKDMWGPGVSPVVVSVPHEGDMEATAADIERARATADVVLASFHWGDAMRPAVITDHELRTGRAAIDAGADVVLGHHHHSLRGVELYRGKPIFYGLGHFVWDAPPGWAARFTSPTKELFTRFGRYGLREREGYPHLPFHPDCRLTMIARCRFQGHEPVWSGFVPCVLSPSGQPTPCPADSPKAEKVIAFVQESCDDYEFGVRLEPDTAELPGGQVALRVLPAV
jgi:poly-gamma-glutamate synthesis protein (capsule biosynthesis protein)